ncbi:uncharacterized protein J7T54_004183 [Emericellopsis cladophorae]|uniref:AA1-like domain-containing protein n=1 Tax=Emericellopsis cladophorae TaxID=2686198 RepID=A0A9P9XV63_9HYPO|nr:uncharacterized protein J7T54_004183 [Emericellopsis cladophorae]KAI6778276.1 hypothetical protein J7T54_004183 [Emericellopsis cladophorae]
MHTILTLLLAGTAAVAAPLQPQATNATCLERSQQLQHWNIENFDYHASYIFTNPAHQNSHGYVNFTLANPALDATATCTASSSQLSEFFYGNQVFHCDVPSSLGGPATFTYSRTTGDLQISQTWTCPDEQARFSAVGGVTLDLDCRDETWQNPDWEQGQLYSVRTVTCDLVDAQAPIREISGIRRKV